MNELVGSDKLQQVSDAPEHLEVVCLEESSFLETDRSIDEAAKCSWLLFFLLSVTGIFSATILKRSIPEIVILALSHCLTFYLIVTTAKHPGFLKQGGPANGALRFCKFCQINQPMRTKHCSLCGFCVATFDHHCFFIGGCVGERNHPKFLFTLLASSLCLIYDCLLMGIIVSERSNYSLSIFSYVAGIFAITVFPAFIIVLLLLYHVYLVLTAQTTWEHLARDKITYMKGVPSYVRQFSEGPLLNAYKFFTRWKYNKPIVWVPLWTPGQAIKFSFIDNKYWSCC